MITVGKAMATLKASRGQLTKQQYKTIKGQILSGNPEGAMRGLGNLMQRRAPLVSAK